MLRSLPFAFAALALVAACSPASAQESEDDFTKRMAERFQAALPDKKIEIGEPLQLRLAGEAEPTEINVGRIFNYCRWTTADECEASVASFVTKIADSFRNMDPPLTSAQLRVAVRHSDYCNYIEGDSRFREKSKSGPLWRPYAAGVCTLILADFPQSARSVTAEELEKIGLDPEAAWALAERQTLANLPSPKTLDGLDDAMSMIEGFDYAPSIMLNMAGWREAAGSGEILLAVPASTHAVVVKRSNIRDLAAFKRTVREDFDTAERGISPFVYRWTKDGWKVVD